MTLHPMPETAGTGRTLPLTHSEAERRLTERADAKISDFDKPLIERLVSVQ